MIGSRRRPGKIVVDFLRRKMPAYMDTGLNVVDVRDMAAGHLLACERGRPGERYILGGENLTLQQIFAKLEGISGLSAPKVQASVCRRLCRGCHVDDVGKCDWRRTACAAGCGEDVTQENVGEPR